MLTFYLWWSIFSTGPEHFDHLWSLGNVFPSFSSGHLHHYAQGQSSCCAVAKLSNLDAARLTKVTLFSTNYQQTHWLHTDLFVVVVVVVVVVDMHR